jgi:hypothetical protein
MFDSSHIDDTPDEFVLQHATVSPRLDSTSIEYRIAGGQNEQASELDRVRREPA